MPKRKFLIERSFQTSGIKHTLKKTRNGKSNNAKILLGWVILFNSIRLYSDLMKKGITGKRK